MVVVTCKGIVLCLQNWGIVLLWSLNRNKELGHTRAPGVDKSQPQTFLHIFSNKVLDDIFQGRTRKPPFPMGDIP